MNNIKQPCQRCGKQITKQNLARHLKQCTGIPKVTSEPQTPCLYCKESITLSNMRRHSKKCAPRGLKRNVSDSVLSTTAKRLCQYPEPSTSAVHTSSISSIRSSIVSEVNNDNTLRSNMAVEETLALIEIEKAFRGRMKTYLINNVPNIKDPIKFLQKVRDLIVEKIKSISKEQNIKMSLVFLVEYKKPANEQDKKEINFKTKNTIVLPTTNILNHVKQAEKKILTEMEEFQAKGSGWSLNKILSLELRINRYIPLRGSTYMKLPKEITSKKAIVNVQNNDQRCFLWSILAALHPVDRLNNPERVHHYRVFEHEFDSYLQGISFPVTLDHIKLFEKRSGISINVYAYDEKFTIYPLLTTEKENEKNVDLLYIKNTNTSHYCLITDLSRLVGSQISSHAHKIWICKRCLLHFGNEDLLTNHKQYCKEHEAVKIEMPKEGTSIKFIDYKHSMRVPFVVYADLECTLTPILPTYNIESNSQGKLAFNRKREPYTEKYQKHDAVSFSYYIVSSNKDYKQPINYFGTNAAQVFVEHLLEESRLIHNLYSQEASVPMELTEEDMYTINNVQQCHICGNKFTEENKKVRDHDHLTGKFRGVAHNSCNLNYRKPGFIPVFIHNLTSYDTHLFIKMFGLNNETINVIPNNEERYISYTVNVKGGVSLRFLDSLRFMASSLDSLVKNLVPDQFKHTSKYFSEDKLKLLLKKGIYPYDYMDSLEKYKLTSLPDKNHFYNKLNMSNITDEDYQHAVSVWNIFEISDMKEYTMLYNQTDVLLLADVMENFRDVCLRTYKLDPAWYYTAPGLAWNAMLKTTNIELELLTDYEMVLMIGEGIRGGISQCSNRYNKANNPYMKEYDSASPNTYLTYLDANNMYGWAMSQYMPYANFKWDDASTIDFNQVPDDSPTGYILEVDLQYPKELHDTHSDLPLAPERRSPPGSTHKKLLTTLFEKTNYVVHYRNLKLYLSLGMKVEKIHRVISFSQKDWLKAYIMLNTQMRTNATNEFEKDFYKLMNNSVFGKTMENIRNRVDVRLATQEKQVDKWIAKPNFKYRTIFTDNLAAVHLSKTKIFFNKPIYVGMSILDISKILIYDFHYNVIKKQYGNKAQLQYTDTDSLTYSIETQNLYDDMKSMIDLFDTSDYPNPNRYNMPKVNKKVLGKMKDELNGRIMYEHVGLRSKMYASRSEKENCKDDGEIKRSKGVKKVAIKQNITFEDYKQCLLSGIDKYSTMNMIRSFKHDLYSVAINRVALSATDDKRYILEDGIKTLPWGHYNIPEEVMLDLVTQSAL